MRVKTGVTRRRHHKIVFGRTKGMRMSKNRLYKVAREADVHKGHYEYVGRRLRKRDIRALWITRINAGLKQIEGGPKYSRFTKALKDANVQLNRKMLAELVISDPETFTFIVAKVGEK